MISIQAAIVNCEGLMVKDSFPSDMESLMCFLKELNVRWKNRELFPNMYVITLIVSG